MKDPPFPLHQGRMNPLHISTMSFMRRQQFSSWFNQPVVPNTISPAGFAVHQTSVDVNDKENVVDWAISNLCYNNDSNIGGYTTCLTTIYREEYNHAMLESSPTLSAMTALSYASGRTVPIPKDFVDDGVGVELENDDLIRAMNARIDLPPLCQSDDRNDCTNPVLLLKRKYDKPPRSPRPAKRRSPDDLYSPKTVRGAGYLKEGLCPLCPEVAWFKIKQSAYWYHMNFTHGISAMTGRPYEMPVQYRFTPLCNEVTLKCRDVLQPCKEVQLEGLCNRCGDWISIVVIPKHMSNLPFKTFNHSTWFKHSQKCHQKSQSRLGKIKSQQIIA